MVDYQQDLQIEREAPSQNKDIIVVEVLPCLPTQTFTIPEPIKPKTAADRMEELILQGTRYSSENESERPAKRAKYLNSLSTRWRFVFNTWPRDATGKRMSAEPKSIAAGKVAGAPGEFEGAVMWGETLADFYNVQDYPTCPVQLRLATASWMYAWCRAEGEDHAPARQLMRLAEMEGRPHVVPVYSVERLIRNSESWVRSQEGASWARPVWPDGKADGEEREAWKVPDLWPPKSVFDPSAYPQRWPLEPFKSQWWHPKESFNNFVHTPVLQQYIPQHLLPEKLVVHDPWNLLRAQSCYDRTTPWVDKDDEVRIYKLKPPATKGLVVRQNKDIAEWKLKTNMAKSVRDHFLANPHSNRERPDGMVYPPANAGFKLGPSKPPVYIVFPPKPNTQAAKTAHLYISPAARLGTGNHSFVYRAEYEVPRSFLVDEEICKECVLNDVKRILEEEDGPNGDRRDGRWDELSGRYTIKLRGKPPRNAMFGEEELQLTPDTQEVEMVYEGPYRAIQTTVGYQNLERAAYCEHLREENIHPLTTKVQVAAKLSIQHDDHLPKEAANYQRFPKDFFEHYNGFNVVKPLLIPTPVGAIVPQFYGYYVLDKEDEQNKECTGYSSPILLVEECGAPIEPEGLSMDDRTECASLIHRMHAAKWYHGSPFKRNIVRQPGPLSAHPMIRKMNSVEKRGGLGTEWSYRLIDFGRSADEEHADDGDYEENMNYENRKLTSWLAGNRTFS